MTMVLVESGLIDEATAFTADLESDDLLCSLVTLQGVVIDMIV